MRTKLLTCMMIAGSLALASCSSHRTVVYTPNSSKNSSRVSYRRVGPPPHAPAHGYRHKHAQGVELVYDSKLEVYVVVECADHYYQSDHFYRLRSNVWEVSASIEGPWKKTSVDKIPPGLQKTAKKEAKKEAKGRGHGKRP